MALEGTLRDFSLADIFQLIGLQRKTGVLTLKGTDDTVTVTFLDGKVVAADSLKRKIEDRIGHVLVRTGYLTPAQLERALEIQKETLQRIGFILTHNDIISAEELREALQLQILQVIYRLFRWNDGEYHFSQETTIEVDHDNLVPISAESILMEGARMIDEWPIIEKRIRSFDLIFRKKPIEQQVIVVADDDAEIDFDESTNPKKGAGETIHISRQEKAIYDLVNGKSTVGEIVESSRYSEFDTAKALYELLSRDLIEEVRADQKRSTAAPRPAEDLPYEVPSALPLPLIIVIALIALASLVTGVRNPLNLLTTSATTGPLVEAKKAISLVRVDSIGNAIRAFELANGRLPDSLEALPPDFISPRFLRDPWGYEYKFIRRPEKYLVIGFLPDGKPDTDLFFTHKLSAEPFTDVRPPAGGIQLID
jgi:hypothetical protein